MEHAVFETRRRSVIKALIWRFVGIAWTWAGVYLILLLVPKPYRSVGLLATLIVVYHHSTRMVMYYFYERLWSRIQWGKTEVEPKAAPPLSLRAKLLWGLGTFLALAIIFYLLFYVMPKK